MQGQIQGGGGPGGQDPPFFVGNIGSTVNCVIDLPCMLHAGEAHSPPACILPWAHHCSLKAVWSLYVPRPLPFKIAGYAPAMRISKVLPKSGY